MSDWLSNAVFYEIYPQSFMDSNADGIGDFGGILQKLPAVKQLGCNAIWLNPCFESPFGDAGYDISDYYKAAPRYGTNEQLRQIFDEVHSLGMHIILDLVPGHTSIEHEWFKQSMKAERNEYSDRYVWTDSVWEEPQGMGCIRGISDRDGSCAVNFFSHQPALNYGFYNPDPDKGWQQRPTDKGPMQTLEALKDIMRFWLKMGCDGFRVDMAGSLVKHDEQGKGTIALWQKIRSFLDEEFPNAVMVSEWGEPDKSLQAGFHMDFLLHFGPSHYNDLFRCERPYFSSKGEGDCTEFVKKYIESYQKSEQKGLICIPSGNHDMDRLARYLTPAEMKIAFAFLLSMPGAPFIYYGDEIGMRYVEGLTSVEGGYGRTGSRSPMQWDNSLNSGFSTASPDRLYIPIDSEINRPDLRTQQADKDSLYNEVKRLIEIRMSHKALQSNGRIEFISSGYPLCYTVALGGEKILVIINPAARETRFPCTEKAARCIYNNGGEAVFTGEEYIVPPCSAGFYEATA